jgi:Leucine-rich repeat (LRR) protein
MTTMATIMLIIGIGLAIGFVQVECQSTCPLQSIKQKCKCGIKTDGQIYIYCARKSLTQIPLFTRNSILYNELILTGNQISTIGANSFNGLKVKSLYMDKNPVRTIAEGSFVEIANYLEDLVLDVDVSSNQVPVESIFTSLLNLKLLKLNGFNMYEIDDHLFNKTRKLEHIEFNTCNLNRVGAHGLDGLESSLKILDLNENSIENVDYLLDVQLVRLKRLQVMHLSHNRIKKLSRTVVTDVAQPQSMSDMAAINSNSNLSLDLSFNEIASIDANVFEQSGMRIVKLHLSNNELNLNSNEQFTFLKNLKNLRELYLDYNRIERVTDDLLTYLNKIEILSLKGNYIRELTIAATHMPSLRKLNMAANKLIKIDTRAAHLTGLKELNLDRNYLDNKQIGSLHGLVNLEVLKLASNLIGTFDTHELNVFANYLNLTYLDLDQNLIKIIPYFVNLNKTLITLSLASNQVCNVNLNNVQRFYSSLKNLNLNLNKHIRCTCPLYEYFVQHLNGDKFLSNTICKSDGSLSTPLTAGDSSSVKCIVENNVKSSGGECDVDYALDLNGFDIVRVHTDQTTATTLASTLPMTTTATLEGPNHDTTRHGLNTKIPKQNEDNFMSRSEVAEAAASRPSQAQLNTNEQGVITKQMVLGSLIGALFILLVLFLILVCIKKLRAIRQSTDKTNSNTNLIKPNVVYIRSNTNALDPYFQYTTTGTNQTSAVPIYVASSSSSNKSYDASYNSNNSSNSSRKNSLLKKFANRLFGKKLTDKNAQIPCNVFISDLATLQQQQQQPQPFLIQHLSRTLNKNANISCNQDTTKTTKTASTVACAFICTPAMSRPTSCQQDPTSTDNNNYQHMYHEICDTLLSKNSSSFNSNDLNYLNGNFFVFNKNTSKTNKPSQADKTHELFI